MASRDGHLVEGGVRGRAQTVDQRGGRGCGGRGGGRGADRVLEAVGVGGGADVVAIAVTLGATWRTLPERCSASPARADSCSVEIAAAYASVAAGLRRSAGSSALAKAC